MEEEREEGEGKRRREGCEGKEDRRKWKRGGRGRGKRAGQRWRGKKRRRVEERETRGRKRGEYTIQTFLDNENCLLYKNHHHDRDNMQRWLEWPSPA